jgi:cobalt-zinc-cadmium efflux system membrane fusion protein
MNRLFHFSSLLLLPTSLCLSGCTEETTEPLPRPDTQQLPAATVAALQTDSVQLAPIQTELRLEGRISPNSDRLTPVYALAGGVVEQAPVALGDVVTAGQPLAVLRSAQMVGLAQQRTEATVNLGTARVQLEAVSEMHADGMSSDQDLSLARAALQKAQAELTRLRKQTDVYGTAPDHYTLRAPQAGTVIEKHLTEGQQFDPGQVGSLFTVANLDEVWVLADVFQSDIEKVKAGLPVEVHTLSYPDRQFAGRVDKVFNMLDPERKTLQVRVRLANPDHLLKPGMFARIHLTQTSTTRLPAVPSASLVFANGRRYALVVKNNTVETRLVAVQHAGQGMSYVSSGLTPGEQVVTRNALLYYKELND